MEGIRISTVGRPHVDAILAAASSRPAVLVLAPSGYGKTEAVRAFVRGSERPWIILRLEARSGDVSSVVGALAERLSGVVPGMHLAFVTASQRWTEPEPLAAWFREAVRSWRGTIVLDDAHHAAPSTARFLDALIAPGAAPARWIVAGRTPGALPVDAWIAAGVAAEPIGEDRLRLVPAEIATLAAEHAVDPRELRGIDARPASIALALDLIASGTVPAPFVRVARDLDALVGAAVDTCDRAERDALERFALLGFVDAPLMSALGASVGNALMRVRARLSSAFDGAAGTFELRSTFREAVLAGGIATPTIETTADALERAGRVAEALALLDRHGNESGVRHVVERHGERFVTEGTPPMVAAVLARLGHRADESAAVLALRGILASHSGHYDTSDSWFENALARAAQPLRGTVAFRFALDLLRRGRPDVVEVARDALAEPGIEPETHAMLLSVLGAGHALAGDMVAARRAIDDALSRRGDVTDPALVARLLHQAGWVALRAGDGEAARRFAEEALFLARNAGAHDVVARAYTVLYQLGYDSESPATLLALLEELAHHATLAGDPYLRSLALLGAYDLEALRGNEDALVAIEASLRWLDAGPSIDGAVVQSLLPGRAMRAAWSGDFALAYRLLAGSSAAVAGDDQRAVRAAEIALYAVLAGEADVARLSILEAERGGNDARSARIAAFLAFAETLLGEPAAAIARIDTIHAGSVTTATLREAARAFAERARGTAGGRELAVALSRLDSTAQGGIARLLAAIPLERLRAACSVRPH